MTHIPEEGPIERFVVRSFWVIVFLMAVHGTLELFR